MAEKVRKAPTLYHGQVTRLSSDKTIKVELKYQVKHPKYGKILNRHTIAHVHDQNNSAKVGDVVYICKCRPLSKTKAWRLVRIVEPAATQPIEQE